MQEREFHPLELAMPAMYLIVVYYALFSTFTPFFSKSQSGHSIYERAHLLMRRGNFSQARVYVQELNNQYPANHVYWMLRADVEHRLNHLTEEMHALEQVMVYSSVPDEVCPRIGETYREAGQNEKSLDAYRRCLKLDPNNSDFHLYLGLAEERAGNSEAAINNYRACLIRSATYLDCSTGLARIHLTRHEPRVALLIMNSPINKGKVDGDADALLTRAQAQRAMGQRDLARIDLRMALNRAPNYADVWGELAIVEREAGNKAAADKALLRANELRKPPSSEAVAGEGK